MDVSGFLLLTEALFRQKRHEDAVAWYKTGIEIHPDNEELLKGLKKARVAETNELLNQVYQARNDFTETVTYLMSSLFVHYAHVRSKIKSMTLFADIDAATQKIHRICCGATVETAAVVSLILSKTVQQHYLICCHYRELFKRILTKCVMNTSEYGVLLQILSSPLEKVEAEMLREPKTEVERKRDSTFSVVMARSNAEVALQKNTYEETYDEDLEARWKDCHQALP
ncbi:hypothetical protein PsorP6_009818 [Peronosclerospora sorghi]|uniref:Uncharacterized protein n=1 Tax=Peronosclerospora sorghi TaxID=230839 RepID=A0ACC0W116_9STRA|nr:hypothetical protein PsorP6_009818 [Peronosclerospora sorghi]